MPKLMNLVRTAKGLQSQYNQVYAQEGALLEAQNVEIKREGVISKSRGMDRYGVALPSSDSVLSLMEFNDRIVGHQSTSMVYDTDGAGTWGSWEGTFNAPDSDTKIRAVEENGVFLFTSYYGCYRTDALTTSPKRAGIPTGLTPTLAKSGTGGGWFSGDQAVGYVIVWGREDAQNNLLLGAPSFRETLTNSKYTSLAWSRSGTTVTVTQTAHGYSVSDTIVIESSSDTTALPNGSYSVASVINANSYTVTGVASGGTSGTCTVYKEFDVTLTAQVPQDIVEGDFYEVYRTQVTAAASVDPGSRFYKIARGGVGASDVLHGLTGLSWTRSGATVTVTHAANGLSNGDTVRIYNSSETTPLPNGTYIVSNVGTDVYDVTGVASGAATGTCSDSWGGEITFSDLWDDYFLGAELYTNANRETITQQNSRPPFALDIALFKGYVWYANTKKPQSILLRLLDISGIVDNTDSISWNDGTDTYTYTFSTAENQTANKFQRYTTGLDSENIRDTAKSLCRIINGDPANTQIYAYYVSGTDDPPGYIVLEARVVNSGVFYLLANAGTPAGVWSPELPTSAGDVVSDDDAGANRVYHSKFQEAEHVPDFNYEEIGGRSNAIKRILPLRDSLIVLGTEGVWRVSGEEESSFVYKQLDPSVKVRHPEAAVVLNNSVFAMSTQGVVKITESGTSIVSRPIEEDLKQFYSGSGVNMHAVGYESERKYMLWVDDSDNTIYQYNYLTQSWTTRIKPAYSAHVLQTSDLLYMASTDPYILQERKNIDANGDYMDEEIAVSWTPSGEGTDPDGNTVSVLQVTWNPTDSAEVPAVGWQVYQNSGTAKYANVIQVTDLGGNSYELLLDRVVTYVTGTGSIFKSIPSRVRWAPEVAGSAGAMKQFIYAQIYLESLTGSPALSPWRFKMGFSTDVYTTETFAANYDLTTIDRGIVLRTVVPRECQRCRALNLVFTHDRAGERFDIDSVAFSTRLYSDRTAVTTP